MNNLNIPDDKLNTMLQMAGQRLGRDPEELRSELQSGKMDNILGGLDPKAAGQIQGLLQNPKALEAMLQNDKVKNLLNSLMGGQK